MLTSCSTTICLDLPSNTTTNSTIAFTQVYVNNIGNVSVEYVGFVVTCADIVAVFLLLLFTAKLRSHVRRFGEAFSLFCFRKLVARTPFLMQMNHRRTKTRSRIRAVTLCTSGTFPPKRQKLRCMIDVCLTVSMEVQNVLHDPFQVRDHFSGLYSLNKPDWEFSGYFCGLINKKRSRLPHTTFHRFVKYGHTEEDNRPKGCKAPTKYPLPVRVPTGITCCLWPLHLLFGVALECVTRFLGVYSSILLGG